jgi:hypothetical protein
MEHGGLVVVLGLDWTGLDWTPGFWILEWMGQGGSRRARSGGGKREAGMKYASTGNDNVLDKGGGVVGGGEEDDYTCFGLCRVVLSSGPWVGWCSSRPSFDEGEAEEDRYPAGVSRAS